MADLNSTLVRGNLRVTDAGNIGTLAVNSLTGVNTINGLAISSSVGTNSIPVRDSSGYVYFNYINTNVNVDGANTNGSGISSSSTFLYTNSDGWIRKASAANFRAAIGAGTSSLGLAAATNGSSNPYNGTATTAARSDHTHAISLAAGGTSTINLAANTTYTLSAGGNSVIFKTPDNTWRPIGTGATDAAKGNHVHSVTAAGDVTLNDTASSGPTFLQEASFSNGVLTLVTKHMGASFTGTAVDTGTLK